MRSRTFLLLILILAILSNSTLLAAQLKLPRYYGFWVPDEGGMLTLPIKVDSLAGEISGFRLCLVERTREFTVVNVEPGALMTNCGWEYLNWQRLPMPASTAYPYGPALQEGNNLIEITGFASTTESFTPSCYSNGTSMELVRLRLSFAAVSWEWDINTGCAARPLNFFWRDCNDNILYSRNQDTLYATAELLDFDPWYGILQPISYPFPGFGSPDSTCTPNGTPRVPTFSAMNGQFDYACVDNISSIGDLNCDGFHYSSADAVVYGKYFRYGLAALPCNIAQVIAESDINRDGIPLTVADLVLLYQIVSSYYFPPYNPWDIVPPKLAPNPVDAELSLVDWASGSGAFLKSDQPVAACYLKLVSNSDRLLREDQFHSLAPGAAIGSIGDTVTLLWIDLDGRSVFDGGQMSLFETDDPTVSIAHAEVVDMNARSMVVSRAATLPTQFSLKQNVPNPFNPMTVIEYTLPTDAHVSLEIFNVNGQRVNMLVDEYKAAGRYHVTWHAVDQDGHPIASGLYFYRLQVGQFSSTRKMLLLK